MTLEEAHYIVAALPDDIQGFLRRNDILANHQYGHDQYCHWCRRWIGNDQRRGGKDEICPKHLDMWIEKAYTNCDYEKVYKMDSNMNTEYVWQK